MQNLITERPKRTFAVTGRDHGSIVEAKNKAEAKRIFSAYYNGEPVRHVKDLSNSNIQNL